MTSMRLPRLGRYRMRFRAEEKMWLSDYTGSAWRGLLGHGLRRVSCVTRASNCRGCLLQGHCVHARIFESLDERGANGGYRARPHPFVLAVPARERRVVEAGGQISLEVVLLGEANRDLPYLVRAMRESGKLGMGRTHARFSLAGIEQEARPGSGDWQAIHDPASGALHALPVRKAVMPPAPAAVRVRLITPLRMKRNGRLVGPREFSASDFMRQLWRRCRDIAGFYGSEEGSELPVPQSRADAFDETAERDLRWHDWSRYSSRQKSRMQMGGVVGSLCLRGEMLQEWWPLLWHGQWLHLGKGTSMGLGQYRLHMPQACRVRAAQRQWVS